MNFFYYGILFFVFSSFQADCQNNSDSLSNSFNNRGVEFAESENYAKSIQNFERAIRTNRSQRKVALDNLGKLKSEIDLPAHSWLHFGWADGIGKAANIFFPNFWLIFSMVMLLTIIYLFYRPIHWSFKKIIPLVILALVSFMLSYLRAGYLEGNNLVIFTRDTELKEKPYDVSDEKQVVFEGQMARVDARYEGFAYVQTDTYESGWVAEEDLIGIWEDGD